MEDAISQTLLHHWDIDVLVFVDTEGLHFENIKTD